MDMEFGHRHLRNITWAYVSIWSCDLGLARRWWDWIWILEMRIYHDAFCTIFRFQIEICFSKGRYVAD